MIRRTPEFAPAHSRLAQSLASLHRLDEAAATYREAIRLSPRFAVAYAGLGGVLRQLGDFDAASAAFRTAFEIQPEPQWQAMVRNELARTTRWSALAPRLAGVLQGSDHPRDAAEALEFAYLAHARLEFAGAARLFALAFRVEPRLADDLYAANRYNAACCAALAARGRDPGEPRATGRALEWLRADLTARSGVVRGGQDADRAQLRQALGHWKVDPELAGLRDPRPLPRSPSPSAGAGRPSGPRSIPSSPR